MFQKKPEAPTAPTPYKIEAPATVAVQPPVETKPQVVKKTAKPTVKKATTRKPRTPKV